MSVLVILRNHTSVGKPVKHINVGEPVQLINISCG